MKLFIARSILVLAFLGFFGVAPWFVGGWRAALAVWGGVAASALLAWAMLTIIDNPRR